MNEIKKIDLVPEEEGSFEVTEENKVVRNPEVSAGKYLKNEMEFIDSPARKEVVSDLLDSWEKDLSFDDIVEDNETSVILFTPDNFIASLINLEQGAKDEDGFDDFIGYLDDAISKIEGIKIKLEDKRTVLVEERLDYEEDKSILMNNELKQKLETALRIVDVYLANAQKVLDYAKTRRNEIII